MRSQKLLLWLATSLFLMSKMEVAFSQTNFWQQTNGPYGDGATVYSLAINSSGHIFAGTFSGVYQSTDDGGSWTHIGLSNRVVISLALNTSGHIFAGTVAHGAYRSTNNGAGWQQIDLEGPSPVTALAVNSSGYIFAGTVLGGVFRSNSNGSSWQEINNGLPDYSMRAFAINTNEHIFVGVGFLGTGGSSVFRSTDNGDNWTPTGLNDVYVVCLAVNASGHIFAGAGGMLFRSTDNGSSWQSLTNIGVQSISINANGHIFVGTGNAGVFLSMDNGDNWMQINTGLTVTDVRSLAINSNGYIFAGTLRGGVFRSVSPTTSVREINSSIPNSFLLEQNYPNPFNPETAIRFQLPEAGYVMVKIFNTVGEEIRTLVDGQDEIGYHRVHWDGKDKNGNAVASGVYLYQLRAGSFSQVRKMSLVR